MLDTMADTDLSHARNGPLDSTATSRAPCYSIPVRTSVRTRPWACIVTHPQAERWAEANLRRIGYEVFLPLYAVLVRDPVLHTRTLQALKPLFPRYMFVRFDHKSESWSPVRASPGVADILRSDGQTVAYAPEAAISALQASEASRRTLTPPSDVWQPGSACAAVLGVGQRVEGVVVSVRGQKAIIGAIMFGAIREVSVDLDRLLPRSE